MNTAIIELIEKAKALSDIDKLVLVDELLAQLNQPDPEIDRVWADEAEKRLKMYREGRLESVPYEKVMEKYRRP
jgi:putative addiction module component (TIGR02574 family)